MLGRHLLMCGDSTDPAARALLMGGDEASLLFTSPPYGNQRRYTTGGIGDWDGLMRGVFGGVGDVLAPDGQVLVNLGMIHNKGEWHPYWEGWVEWMRSEGWRRFGWYVWDQGSGMPGERHGRLGASFEFLFHFNRSARSVNKVIPCKYAGEIKKDTPGRGTARGVDGTARNWSHAGAKYQDFCIPDNVIRVPRARDGRTGHPAVFPVALPEFVINAWTAPGEIVFEPFSGSGTTIIAGERSGRTVRAMELAPEYCGTATARWDKLYPEQPSVRVF